MRLSGLSREQLLVDAAATARKVWAKKRKLGLCLSFCWLRGREPSSHAAMQDVAVDHEAMRALAAKYKYIHWPGLGSAQTGSWAPFGLLHAAALKGTAHHESSDNSGRRASSVSSCTKTDSTTGRLATLRRLLAPHLQSERTERRTDLPGEVVGVAPLQIVQPRWLAFRSRLTSLTTTSWWHRGLLPALRGLSCLKTHWPRAWACGVAS